MDLSFGDYIIYADESGDHSLGNINEQNPLFVLAFCIFKKIDYTSIVLPSVNQFKFKFWGHDLAILHNREIRRPEKDFGFLTASQEIRDKFLNELTELIQGLPFSIVATVVDKRLLKEKHTQQDNPYELALRLCLECAYSHLQDLGATNNSTNIIVEQRGLNEDKDLELAFRRIIDSENHHKTRLPFDIKLANKKVNSCGLQLADLIAYPIGRHILNPEHKNRSFEVLEKKIVGDKEKNLSGLRIFE